jgi:DDE superfamily endonuclease/Helix-turn-helix of DDE superfamily endonuclease
MLSYARLSRTPSIFRSFAGLEVHEFDSLRSKIEAAYPSFEEKRLSKEGKRKREMGAGHPFKLSLQDRFLMLLVYYRLYVTSTLVGYLFDLGQTNVLKDIRLLEPAVRECLPLPKKMQKLTRRLRTIEEVEEFFPGFKAYIDATEQEIPRPKKDTRKRKTHYSGKKKRHTVKTQLTVNSKGLIIHKTDRHARGRRHDLDVYRERHPDLPKQVQSVFDLGYKGVMKDFPELNCVHPFKRRGRGRGHRGEKAEDLTPEQKAFNRELSKQRVVVEHTISRVKKFRMMGEEFRNRLKRYDVMTDIVSGLVNLRILGTATVI